MEPALSQRVKAGCTQGGGLEKGVEQFLPQGHVPQRGGIVVFRQQGKDGAEEQQSRRHHQHQFAVQGELAPAPAAHQILPDEKSQAADDDEGGRGEQYNRVMVRPDHTGKGAVLSAHQIKARVAERGDGVEDAMPDPPEQSKGWNEADGEDHRPHPLDQKGAHERMAYHAHHTIQIVEVEGGHHDEPLRQADAAVERKGHHGDEGHKAKAPQLDHHNDDDLPKEAPLDPGIHGNESGDAGG